MSKNTPKVFDKNAYAVCGASKMTLDLNTVSGFYVDNKHITIVFSNGFRFNADEIVFENPNRPIKFYR